MSLQIDRLKLILPTSLANRKLAIKQLLRSELNRFNWPSLVTINQLSPKTLELSPQQTNLHIAKAIANNIHRATLSAARSDAHHIKVNQVKINQRNRQPITGQQITGQRTTNNAGGEL